MPGQPGWRRVPSPRLFRSADDADRDLDPAVARAAGLVTVVVEESGLVPLRVEEEPFQECVRTALGGGLAVLDDHVGEAVRRAAHLDDGRVVGLVVGRAAVADDHLGPCDDVAGLRAGALGLGHDRIEDLGLGRAHGDGLDGEIGRRAGAPFLTLTPEEAVLESDKCGAEGHAEPPVLSARIAGSPLLAI